MSFQFHPEAEAEFLAAVDWHEGRSAGLGGDFAAEIHAAIRRAVVMPLAWPPVDGEIRRYWPIDFLMGRSLYLTRIFDLRTW